MSPYRTEAGVANLSATLTLRSDVVGVRTVRDPLRMSTVVYVGVEVADESLLRGPPYTVLERVDDRAHSVAARVTEPERFAKARTMEHVRR